MDATATAAARTFAEGCGLGGGVVHLPALAERLRVRAEKGASVEIRADRSVSQLRGVSALDLARRAGREPVSIAVEGGGGSPRLGTVRGRALSSASLRGAWPDAAMLDSARGMGEIAPRIVVDEHVHSGRPVLKGSRVPVDVVLGQLAAGLTVGAVATEYGLEREDVLAALAYAAQTVGDEEVRSTG